MSSTPSISRSRPARMMDQFHARLAGRAKPAVSIVSQPEPRTVGQFARGRQLSTGKLLLAGRVHDLKETSLWDIAEKSPNSGTALHGFTWLDDLAAVGDVKSRRTASTWVFEWIDRYGSGTGPGWTPEVTGRRLIRWICHALFILRGASKEQSHAFYRSLGQQSLFLSRRWKSAPTGLSRFEALAGMIHAGLSLEGFDDRLKPTLAALEQECRNRIDRGGIASRNPEELLEVFTLLSWSALVLKENNRIPGKAHTTALARMAETLRALRHADGSLARFHGGGVGPVGQLDQALASAEQRGLPGPELYMGFGRLQGARTSVIMDVAPPPKGDASGNAHASTLALEVTSGRCPLIVNCGSGAVFGDDWHRAGRATPSHSTLCLEGRSSALLRPKNPKDDEGTEFIVSGPSAVPWSISRQDEGTRLEAGHDGYVEAFGLMHARTLTLSFDGKRLLAEDFLTTLTPEAEAQFDRALDERALKGLNYAIRFHLHPDVEARLDMGGSAASLTLRNGDVWVFRPEQGKLSLAPSIYLQKGRLKPRAARQIVLEGSVHSYASRVRWSLTKVTDAPLTTDAQTDWDLQTQQEDTYD